MTDTDVDITGETPAGPELLHGVPVTTAGGQQVLHPSREQYLDLLRVLADDGYVMCIDLCAVDYLTHEAGRPLPDGVEPERFEVVVNLLDLTAKRRTRVRVQVPADDADASHRCSTSTPAPRRWSAKRSTCSASCSRATPILRGS